MFLVSATSGKSIVKIHIKISVPRKFCSYFIAIALDFIKLRLFLLVSNLFLCLSNYYLFLNKINAHSEFISVWNDSLKYTSQKNRLIYYLIHLIILIVFFIVGLVSPICDKKKKIISKKSTH